MSRRRSAHDQSVVSGVATRRLSRPVTPCAFEGLRRDPCIKTTPPLRGRSPLCPLRCRGAAGRVRPSWSTTAVPQPGEGEGVQHAVLEFKHDALRTRGSGDVDAAPRWRVGDGVVDQVVQDPRHQPNISFDGDARLGGTVEGHTPLPGVSGGVGQRIGDQIIKGEGGEHRIHEPRGNARQLDDLVDKGAQTRVPQLSACPGDGLGRLRWWAVEQSL